MRNKHISSINNASPLVALIVMESFCQHKSYFTNIIIVSQHQVIITTIYSNILIGIARLVAETTEILNHELTKTALRHYQLRVELEKTTKLRNYHYILLGK